MMSYLVEAVILAFLVGGILGSVATAHWIGRNGQTSHGVFLGPQKAKVSRKRPGE